MSPTAHDASVIKSHHFTDGDFTMKLLTEPGVSLFAFGVFMYFFRIALAKIPFVGGLLSFLTWPVVIFCAIAGVYLLVTSFRQVEESE